MTRRKGTVLSLAIVAVWLVAAACGSAPREDASPPPLAAKDEVPPAEASPVPIATAGPVAETPPQPERAAMPPPTAAAAATRPSPTPNVESAPGAIPPAALPDPSAAPSEKPVDPLKWMQDRKARRYDYERQVQAAKDLVDAAAAEAASWDRVALEFKNPFLPRPQLKPEDAQAIAGMSNPERVKWAGARAADARTRQLQAQGTLDTLLANPVPE